MRVDGIYVANMSVSYGGTVCSIHSTVVAEVEFFKGILAVENTQ